MQRIKVVFLGPARDMAGVAEVDLELDDRQSVGMLAGLLSERFPKLGSMTGIRLAVNQRFVAMDHPLSDGDEVGVIPPVSGGAPDVSVQLVRNTIDVAELIRQAAIVGHGAVASFCGVVRPEQSGALALKALDYEAYEEMALSQMREICRRNVEKHGLLHALVVHRLGRIAIGETSIAVVVTSEHRAAAFEACRCIVDAIKMDVPIWKKDVWSDGSQTWVDPTTASE